MCVCENVCLCVHVCGGDLIPIGFKSPAMKSVAGDLASETLSL